MSESTLRLEPVIDQLPADIDAMRAEANAEGYQFVERLHREWEENVVRFREADETLLAAYMDGTLVAIGGITRDPVVPDAMRMRRLYVRHPYRGRGVGRRLTEALL